MPGSVDWILKNGKGLEMQRLHKFPVTGAFHTNLIAAAVEPFAKTLKQIELLPPHVHIDSNYSTDIYREDLKTMRKNLIKPLTKSVR
jgi:[acyl-carrier-protein] S-malonyltransferase